MAATAVLVGGLIAGAVTFFWPRLTVSPAEAVAAFYLQPADAPRETLADPLVLAGSKVVPVLLRDVAARRDLPHRQAAIRFLGEFGGEAAMPALDQIIEDDGEPGYARCDALIAIALIHRTEGINRAIRHKSRLDDLGYCAKQVIAGVYEPGARRYWQVRLGVTP